MLIIKKRCTVEDVVEMNNDLLLVSACCMCRYHDSIESYDGG